jgi:hypothetical protein
MNQITLAIETGVKEYSEQIVYSIILTRETLAEWCLGLSLVKYALVDSLVLSKSSRAGKVAIKGLDTKERSAKAEIYVESSIVQLRLTPTQLDYILAFCLKYYRDGIADVDHIDIPAVVVGKKKLDAYITVVAAEYVPPMTPDELRKRLGDA